MADNSYQKAVESLWFTSRFLMVLCGISIVANLTLALAFFAFFPIKKVEPYYLQIDTMSNKQVYLQKDFDINSIQKMNVEKVLIKKYVLQREQFSGNPISVDELWGKSSYIFYASSPSVYQGFENEEKYDSVINQRNPKKTSRIVNIQSVDYLEGFGKYVVKGNITDYEQSGRVEPLKFEQNFEVEIVCEFSKEKIYLPYKERLKNPFGFVISKYEYNRTVPY